MNLGQKIFKFIIPYVVNPLSVATNKSGKKRLILDLSVLNKFVKKHNSNLKIGN
jgi:hypothetical protein